MILSVGSFFVFNSLIASFTSFVRDKALMCLSLFFLASFFSIVFSFRDGILISTDYINYIDMFDGFPYEFDLVFKRVEPFFGFLIYLVRGAGWQGEFFLILVSFFFHGFLAYFCYRFSLYPALFFLLLTVTSAYFNFASNTIRQGLACSIFLASLSFGGKKGFFVFVLSVFTHYSALFLFFPVYFGRVFGFLFKKKYVLSILFFSFSLYVVDFGFFWQWLSWGANALGLPPKVLVNFQSDEVVVSGRGFYIFSVAVVFLGVFFERRVLGFLHSINGVKVGVYKDIFRVLFFSVVFYPVFSQFSYFVRVASYGFFLSPFIFGVILFSFFEKRFSIFISLIFYLSASFALYFQLDYLVL